MHQQKGASHLPVCQAGFIHGAIKVVLVVVARHLYQVGSAHMSCEVNEEVKDSHLEQSDNEAKFLLS